MFKGRATGDCNSGYPPGWRLMVKRFCLLSAPQTIPCRWLRTACAEVDWRLFSILALKYEYKNGIVFFSDSSRNIPPLHSKTGIIPHYSLSQECLSSRITTPPISSRAPERSSVRRLALIVKERKLRFVQAVQKIDVYFLSVLLSVTETIMRALRSVCSARIAICNALFQ